MDVDENAGVEVADIPAAVDEVAVTNATHCDCDCGLFALGVNTVNQYSDTLVRWLIITAFALFIFKKLARHIDPTFRSKWKAKQKAEGLIKELGLKTVGKLRDFVIQYSLYLKHSLQTSRKVVLVKRQLKLIFLA